MLKDKGYIGKQGLSCLSACYVNYLNYRGYKITETDVLLSNNFKVFYYQDENGPQLKANVYEAILNCYHNFGIQCDIRHLDGDITQGLRDLVEKDTLLTLEVGYGSLDYNAIFQHSQSAEHYINVIGIKDNMVYIDDSYIPVFPPKSYRGWYDLDKLERAWKEKSYSYRVFGIPDNIPLLKENYEPFSLLKPFLENYLAGGKDSIYIYGVDAIDMIKKDIDAIGLRNPQEVPQLLFDYNYMIKTKGAFTFKLVILEAMERINQQNPCEDLLLEVKDIVKEWNQFSMLMIKVSMIYKNSKDLIRIKDKLDSIMEHEKVVFNQIISLER